jgi:hypothetical protein
MAKGIALLLLLLSANAFAYIKTNPENCGDKDLRNEFLGPVRDQEEVNWCYAYTAADMISYHHKLPRVSAADVAINYNNTKIARALKFIFDIRSRFKEPTRYWMAHQTGFINMAIKRTIAHGACLEETFPSEYMIRVDLKDGVKTQTRVTMHDAQLQIATLRSAIRKGQVTKRSMPYYFQMEGISPSDFYDVLKNSRRKRVWNNLRKLVCDNRVALTYDRVRSYIRGRKTFKRINQQLDQDNIVGIDYSRDILLNANNSNPFSSMHTSSIVGRRFNHDSHQCEYLIRDSHGPDCAQFDQKWECEAGNVWIPENKLFKNFMRLTYIQL